MTDAVETFDTVDASPDPRLFADLPLNGGASAHTPDPQAVFEATRAFIQRFVLLSREEALISALWAMMTHCVDAFDCVPYLSVTSAEKQCGKTRFLEVLELLVARPWMTGRTTPAVLARKIHNETPTLLLDESDATFKGDKEFAETLRGVLNTGYLRSGKTSLCVAKGKSIEYVDLSTFGPKAIAGIGSLPDTVSDRSIPIRLQRKLIAEPVERLRRRRAVPEAEAIRRQIESWAARFVDSEHPEPASDDDLPDRAADICEPLLTIAEACGAGLAADARRALVGLCGRQREDDSRGVRLLDDIRGTFEAKGYDRITSADLAHALGDIEESPWGPQFGKPFDARALARLLKPFAIKPRTIRLDDEETAKGYHRDQFEEAWARFSPSPEKPSHASQSSQPNEIKAFRAPSTVTQPSQETNQPSQSDEEAPPAPATYPSQDPEPSQKNPHEIRLVTDVTAVTAPRGGASTGNGSPNLAGTASVDSFRESMEGSSQEALTW